MFVRCVLPPSSGSSPNDAGITHLLLMMHVKSQNNSFRQYVHCAGIQASLYFGCYCVYTSPCYTDLWCCNALGVICKMFTSTQNLNKLQLNAINNSLNTVRQYLSGRFFSSSFNFCITACIKSVCYT
jgi:hypothetical protein